jgi:hypothetical protein
MKLLESVLQPSADDLATLEASAQKPFLEFLRERQMTENVIAFLLYSIALLENKGLFCSLSQSNSISLFVYSVIIDVSKLFSFSIFLISIIL